MDYLALIAEALTILQGVLTAANQKGASEVATEIQAAVTKLEGVIGTPVTKAQLESMRG